jgi:hypothetical protein
MLGDPVRLTPIARRGGIYAHTAQQSCMAEVVKRKFNPLQPVVAYRIYDPFGRPHPRWSSTWPISRLSRHAQAFAHSPEASDKTRAEQNKTAINDAAKEINVSSADVVAPPVRASMVHAFARASTLLVAPAPRGSHQTYRPRPPSSPCASTSLKSKASAGAQQRCCPAVSQ